MPLDLSEPNHHGFPHACRTASGRIIVIWREATEHATTEPGVTKARYSDDDGATWAPEYVVQTGTSTLHFRGTCIAGLADGRVIMTSIAVQWSPTITTIPDAGRVQISEDDGLTFTSPSTIDTPYTEPLAAQGNACEMDDGTLLWAPYLNSGAGYKCIVLQSHIDDPLSWTPRSELTGFDGNINTESQLINMGGDNVLALLRVQEIPSDAKYIHIWNSADKGATWTNRRRGFEGQGAPRCIRLRSGTLMSVVRGKLIAGLLNQRPKIYTSIDDGGTWLGPWGLDESIPIEDVYCAPVETSVDNIVLVAYGAETVDHQDAYIRVKEVEVRV